MSWFYKGKNMKYKYTHEDYKKAKAFLQSKNEYQKLVSEFTKEENLTGWDVIIRANELVLQR